MRDVKPSFLMTCIQQSNSFDWNSFALLSRLGVIERRGYGTGDGNCLVFNGTELGQTVKLVSLLLPLVSGL